LALARDWTSGHDEQVKHLDQRVYELERLLREAAERLEVSGEETLANRIKRKLR
jgi:hypothetical protein